ncbi:hypothetical protein FD723_32370 (plasmid) [Nostoc sp. C052]|uniref:restriction endonuclease subunit S n=1 Tax=Nostoc sp. C052 TaxID=2576902 RepID=UPI0015C397B0|nr:restriction endonuclease subunit S [Nostoc sp. C052]QLE45060.1 hypothetical protein FD723_32370 [Nostoc sp. C052]
MHELLIKTEEFKNSGVGRIPKDWQIKTLEECVCPDAQITYGIVQAGPHIEDGIPYIRTGDMAGDKLKLEGLLRTSPKIALSYRRSEVKTGEIVCAIRATVGKVLEVPPELDGANLTQGTARISPNHNINNRFLLWVLRSSYAQLQFNLAVKGTTFAEITLENLRKIKVPLPSSQEEQEKISAILDTVDEAITRTSSLIIKLKQTKAGLLQDLLTRGLDENGKLRDPQAHPEQFKDSSLGRIPFDWQYKRLEEIALKVTDRDHTTPTYLENGVILVSPVNFINDEDINFADCKRISYSAHLQNRKKTDICCGDIILHRIGAGLGRVRLVTQEMPEFSILHSLCMVRPNENWVIPFYLLWTFRTHTTQAQMDLGTQSIGVPDLGLDKILSLIFPVPPLSEQRKIVDALNAHQDGIRKEEVYLNKLKLKKQGLMQDLLTGKVRVKNIK